MRSKNRWIYKFIKYKMMYTFIDVKFKNYFPIEYLYLTLILVCGNQSWFFCWKLSIIDNNNNKIKFSLSFKNWFRNGKFAEMYQQIMITVNELLFRKILQLWKRERYTKFSTVKKDYYFYKRTFCYLGFRFKFIFQFSFYFKKETKKGYTISLAKKVK